MATTVTYVLKQLYQFPLAELYEDPDQPRKYFDPVAQDELIASIKQNGIIDPLVARQDKETGRAYVVAGGRRYAAALAAGLETVPVIFIDGENHEEIAIIENISRQDLTPIEEAEAFDRLVKVRNYTQEDLAKVLSKSIVNVSETLSLNKLPQDIRDECRKDPTVPKKALIGMARKKQERSMRTEYQRYRAAQAKAAEQTTRVATRRTTGQSLIAALNAVDQKTAKTDFGSLAPGDISPVVDALNHLRDTVEAALSKLVK